jgi:ABC-2 type transport system permease protein
MRVLLALWMKEWLALSRDVHGLAVLFLMPAAFIVVMSLALSDAFKDDVRQTEFAVITKNPSFGERLARSLSGDGFRPARSAGKRTEPLILVVPDGLERTLSAPDASGSVPALTLSVDPALPAPQVLAFKQRVVAVVLALRVSASLRRAGIEPGPDAFDPARAVTVNIETRGGAGRLSSVQQNVPAWLIFGMFFVVLPISSLFIVERREGTLARLVSQRVPFAMLLLGRIGPFFAINLVQAALMLAAGRTLVPWLGGETLELPVRWAPLVAVTACTSLAAIGWGLLVAVCARTLEQATVIGGVGNILAAAIGGIMVPRFVMPETMRRIAEISPMAWALDGFHAVILRQGGAADLAVPCLKLLALAAALVAAALWVHQRRRILSSAP